MRTSTWDGKCVEAEIAEAQLSTHSVAGPAGKKGYPGNREECQPARGVHVVTGLDVEIRPVEESDRGPTSGELPLSMASAQLAEVTGAWTEASK